MIESDCVTLTREQLYERVWTTAMRYLAREYGLPDVGLAKICTAHDIPRPPHLSRDIGWCSNAF